MVLNISTMRWTDIITLQDIVWLIFFIYTWSRNDTFFLLCKINGIPPIRPNGRPCTVYSKSSRKTFSQSPFKFGWSEMIVVVGPSIFNDATAAVRLFMSRLSSAWFVVVVVVIIIKMYGYRCRLRVPTTPNLRNWRRRKAKKKTMYKPVRQMVRAVYIPKLN